MIVETPRGSAVKLKYEPELKAFTISRAMPLGVLDWTNVLSPRGLLWRSPPRHVSG
jgi:inorganic pyrophosphatase